jgi:hypothetical protein
VATEPETSTSLFLDYQPAARHEQGQGEKAASHADTFMSSLPVSHTLKETAVILIPNIII